MRLSSIASLLAIFSSGVAVAQVRCGTCIESRPRTLRESIAAADAVAYGRIESAKRIGDGGTTTIVTLFTFQGANRLGQHRRLSIPLYVEADPSARLLFFISLRNGIDVYRGDLLTPKGMRYLAELLALDRKDNQAALRWCFDYLNDDDGMCSNDALLEWSNAAQEDFAKVAAKLPAENLRAWLAKKGLDKRPLNLFAQMLGYCGEAKDAALLKEILCARLRTEPLDGLLIGYSLLKPAECWEFIRARIRDDNAAFHDRYECLRAIRYLHDSRPNVVAAKEMLAAMADLLGNDEMADFVIDDLRQWKEWSLTERVLGLDNEKQHPLVRRAILRYALKCPSDAARRYVNAKLASDPEFVMETKEMLEHEAKKQ
jgi:hypothetical protein